MKRYCSRGMLACILFYFSATELYSWKETTHQRNLTPEAIKLVLVANDTKIGSEIEAYRALIVQGSHDEDFPLRTVMVPIEGRSRALVGRRITVYLRANNHYRHAISGSVLTGAPIIGMGDPDVNTLTWAKTNKSLSEDEEYGGNQWWGIKNGVFTKQELDSGNMSWQKAIERYGYSDHSKRLSYYTLGFVLHLLQDMGVPEHVHDDPHGGSGYTGFEKWVDRRQLLFPLNDNYFSRSTGLPGSGGQRNEGVARMELAPRLTRVFFSCLSFGLT